MLKLEFFRFPQQFPEKPDALAPADKIRPGNRLDVVNLGAEAAQDDLGTGGHLPGQIHHFLGLQEIRLDEGNTDVIIPLPDFLHVALECGPVEYRDGVVQVLGNYVKLVRKAPVPGAEDALVHRELVVHELGLVLLPAVGIIHTAGLENGSQKNALTHESYFYPLKKSWQWIFFCRPGAGGRSGYLARR